MDTRLSESELPMILVVDDEAAIGELIEDFFENRYQILRANNAEQALEVLNTYSNGSDNAIDIVLSDIHLPGMSGLELLKKIKGEFPDTGVIMISGTADIRTAVDAIRKGAFDYIAKPFVELEELEFIVQRWNKMQSLETKLKQYAKLHDDMMRNMKLRTFLSIDVKDSAGMKRGADPFITQYAFQEYHRFVNRCVKAHKGTIHSTAGDGIMACFIFTHEALAAARQILAGLPLFNAESSSLKKPFEVRMGLHTGSAIVEDDGAINSMFSATLDTASHLQQEAAVNTLELSEEALQSLSDHSGFIELDKSVSGHRVYRLATSA